GYHSAPPVAYNGVVYAVASTWAGPLSAIDETNGAVLWTAQVSTDNGSPAVTDTAVYASHNCSEVYALAPLTGRTIWQQNSDCTGAFGGTTVYYNNKVYARTRSPGNLLVVDAKTGKQIQIYNTDVSPVFDG